MTHKPSADLIRFPIKQREVCEFWILSRDECPECGGSLDTGYECNRCGFDAMPEVKEYSSH